MARTANDGGGAVDRTWGARLVVLIPYLWLIVFFLVPFLIVLKISLSHTAIAQPPYTPVFDPVAGWEGLKAFVAALSLENYAFIASDGLYLASYLKSLEVAVGSTVLLLLIGFPLAYGIARAPRHWQPALFVLVVLPFWTSFLIRIYAWVNILQRDGLLNQVLLALRIVDEPPAWLSTDTAVYIGIVYSYLPFMVLPIYATLEKMDETLIEAAADLGCPRWKAFWLVTLPLSLPGVIAGALLCFIPIVGEFVIPDLLGSSQTMMIGQTLWTEFFANRDWPVASAVAVVLLCLLVVPLAVYQQLQTRYPVGRTLTMRKASWFNIGSVALGFAFLYLPIVILVIYSFNGSRLVTVWGGWSTRWYVELLNDRAMLESAWVTLRIALLSATAATVLGTLAAIALVRFGRFRGRMLFSGMIYAPLVMPEVITGLSLLLLFVAVDVDRGFWTITVAHTTLTACFVTVVVQSRLLTFDTSLEEAAMDLGCPPLRTFLSVTLPLIAPALASGWMLAFHAVARRSGDRKLHDRAWCDHVADPHLFGDPARRETGDQCHLHDHDRDRCDRDRRRHPSSASFTMSRVMASGRLPSSEAADHCRRSRSVLRWLGGLGRQARSRPAWNCRSGSAPLSEDRPRDRRSRR